ncbi:hypothetical protein CDR19_21205 [Ectopseudomonas toyotomiensis]|uniref:Uncharacterized protein n=1 Tax=Ectopseudomonas toyotomiensis TaxID=554344 RepID=A0A1I5XA94_9GAMM|nr:hypothetical protein CDR19_21205 [Pseudomonas toyotomiensis]SFQ28567.1 hypothetical protein SAMN05216177_11087 [Pseudomonas toyotomiensis]
MKNTLIGTETVRMERFHLVQKLYSFLDIPGAAWPSTRLKPVKQAHEVRAPLIGALLISGVFRHGQPHRRAASHTKRYHYA